MKLLKLLASKMDEEERKCLPLLLNVFYYRETLFIVYELLRDNLYHMCRRPPPLSPSPKSRPLLHAHCRVNKRCSHCLASYKYIEECRLPKYFTVRPQPPVCGDALLEAPPARPHPIRRSMWCTTAPSRRWIACRKSLGNASTRSIVCISKRSSIAIWCATLRREP